MLAALIPAILYFTGIFIGTHFEAKRLKILGLPKSELPVFKKIFVRDGYMIVPLLVIIVTIMSGFTPQRAALFGILSAFIIWLFNALIRKESEFNFKRILYVLEQGGRVALPVIAAVATAGIIAGVVSMTGLGAKFAAGIIALSNGYLILALFFTMIACIILGMGLPTTANYVVTATIAAPALINEFGIAPIAAHMFVFYFGIVADITPPVCLAAYAGAGIAKANPFKTGTTAVKLAIAAFIIPYIFIYNPILVFVDVTPVKLILGLLTALIGMMGVSSAVIGYFIRNCRIIDRLFLFTGGLLLIIPELTTSTIGLLLITIVWFIQRRRPKEQGAVQQEITV